MKTLVVCDVLKTEMKKINKEKLQKVYLKLDELLFKIRNTGHIRKLWKITWFINSDLGDGFFCEKLGSTTDEKITDMASIDYNTTYFCGVNCLTHIGKFDVSLFLVEEVFIEQNKKLLLNKNIKTESINQVLNDFGEHDVFIFNDYFDFRREEIIEKLNEEIGFGKMYLQNSEVPRGVAIQSKYLDSNTYPVYRHPCDKQPDNLPFTETIEKIVNKINEHMKLELNHALIQKYTDGKSNISEHSDKTLDMDLKTPIINVSFGETRILVLTNKTTREKQKIRLYHNSVFVLGLKTNMKWTHEIIKSGENLCQQRISLTLRKINTFITKIIQDAEKKQYIYGQGGVYKTHNELLENIKEYAETPYSELINAFSTENKSSDYKWCDIYGKGFNFY